MTEPDRATARALAQAAIARGEPTAWFEELYAQADDPTDISWADLAANPSLVSWLERDRPSGDGQSALVVGCGFGDDAEELAARGFVVTAFDISPTAVAWAQRRFPESGVDYVVADALALPAKWWLRFELVLESYTLQVLPTELRPVAAAQMAATVTEGGTLLAIARGRDEDGPPGSMPWPLVPNELAALFANELEMVRMEDYLDDEDPPVRRLRARFSRTAAAAC